MYIAPRQLTLAQFQFSRYIVDLTEEEFEQSKQDMIVMWAGVLELWACLADDIKYAKRAMAFQLLIMWNLADLYPTRLIGGVQSSGGLPIMSKHIRDVSVSYGSLNLPEAYSQLASNQFGVKAAMMISTAPEMMGVYG